MAVSTDLAFRIIVITLTVITLGIVLYTILDDYSRQSCRQELINKLRDFEKTACIMELYDEPVDETLELKSCVDHLAYNAGRLEYQFTGEDQPHERSTACPDGDYVEYLGLPLSREDGKEFDVVITYKTITIGNIPDYCKDECIWDCRAKYPGGTIGQQLARASCYMGCNEDKFSGYYECVLDCSTQPNPEQCIIERQCRDECNAGGYG